MTDSFLDESAFRVPFGTDIDKDTNSREYARDKAQTLLYMPHPGDANYEGINYSLYTPTAANYFKQNGAYDEMPTKGDIVYFRDGSGIYHVGIVKEVDLDNNTFTTIEGNTSHEEFTNNGGVVGSHTYDIDDPKIDGFGTPNFDAVGISPQEFVETAESYLGYEEKASMENIDMFHDNAGSNNYTIFEQETNGTNGNYWCQAFVDYCAQETIEKKALTHIAELNEHYYINHSQVAQQKDDSEHSSKAVEFASNIEHFMYNVKNEPADKIFDGMSIKDLNDEINQKTGNANIFSNFIAGRTNEDIQNIFQKVFEAYDISTDNGILQAFDKTNLEKIANNMQIGNGSLDEVVQEATVENSMIEMTPQVKTDISR